MNLVGYTATALSRNDIEDTPTNKNVVDFAIVELKDLQGNLVTIYDDEEGLNPETQKTCDTDGQVTFFAEIGDYNLEINGKSQRINLTANIADYIKLSTGESVQAFADSFSLKIFQSPTDGDLTEIQTRTVNSGEVYEVRKTSDDSLATIYSDSAGTTEIVQNGTDNASDSDGVVEFYIDDGDYYVEVGSIKTLFEIGQKASGVKFSNGENLEAKCPTIIGGEGNDNYKILLGVIRNTGAGWFFINDDGHAEVNFESISTNLDGTITLGFKSSAFADKIGSLLIGCDETYSQIGVIGGGSVESQQAVITLSAPLTVLMDASAVVTGAASTNGITFPPHFSGLVTAQRNSNNITINHPTVESSRGVTFSSAGAAIFDRVDASVSLTTTYSRFFFKRDLYAYVGYDGANFTASNGNSNPSFSFTWETDHLRITHPSTSNVFDVQISGRYPYQADIGGVSNTYTDVYFRDSSGSLVSTPDTNMRVFISRGACEAISGGIQDIDVGSYAVNIGYAKLNASALQSANGNLWIIGCMKV